MPKMVFYMPTVAAVTTTAAGYFLASELICILFIVLSLFSDTKYVC